MSGEVTPPQTFEERLKGRIKESIGELMTDEDLAKLVHAGMQDVFFKVRVQSDPNGYGRRLPDKPPFLHEIVSELLAPQVEAAVAEWVAANQDEVRKTVAEVVEAGVGMAVVNALRYTFRDSMLAFSDHVDESFRKLGQP